MALNNLHDEYPQLTEKQMVHATEGIITNVRLDHVDVMGHTLPEIANTLGKTIPKNKNFFTTENHVSDILNKIADKKKAIVHISKPDTVSQREMEGFNYIEHKENVSMAIEVCEHLGVNRDVALNGMYKANPDEGALKHYKVNVFNKVINFYNAFAANDSQSTLIIWEMIN